MVSTVSSVRAKGAASSAGVVPTVSRNRLFDLMRLALATCVLLAHAAEITDGNRARELLSRLTHGGLSFGEFGVDGFFLLSGYLITQSWMRDPRLGDFLQKRILRIVPGYLVAVAFSIVAVGLLAPAVPHFFHVPGARALLSVLSLGAPTTSAVFPGDSYPLVNGALWTIAYEFRCYVLLAAAGLVGLLQRRWLVLALTLSLFVADHSKWLITQLWTGDLMPFGEARESLRLLPFFAVGACYYLFRDRIRFNSGLLWAAILALLAVRLAAPRHLELAMGVFGSYLLFYLAQLRWDWLNRQRMPDISYGVYLYGWPVESLWIFYRHGSPWVAFAVSLVICTALGWLSWHFVERPMLQLKRRPTATLPAA